MQRQTYKIIAVGAERNGHSERTNQDWTAQDVVLEEINDQTLYPESFTLSLTGSDIKPGMQVGDRLECTAFIRAREWRDRWINEVRARNISWL